MRAPTMRLLAAVCLLILALPAAALEQVTLQLNWKHQFQFAGYYAAIEQGYYREAGLDVRLVEVDETHDPIGAVLAGKAEFGVGASELALRRGRGEPVVALATILQHSPLVLLARKDASIDNIHDLAGARIMLMPHETELFAYLGREGVPNYRALPHGFDTEDLVAGRTEALSGYLTDEPFALQQAKFPYHAFTPRSSGIDFYGDTLFTTEEQIRSRPERVSAFREASLRGWRYAMQHRAEIADLILAKYSRRHSRAHLLFEANEMARLMRIDLIEIGHMLPGRWRHIAATYAELGMLPSNATIDGLIWTPGSRPLPAWVVPGFAVAALFLLGAAAAAWRHMQLNARLNDDIAKRKLVEEALRESEERYRLLAENTADVVWQADADLVFTYVNEADERLRGFTRAEVVGRPLAAQLAPESLATALRLQKERFEAERRGIRTTTTQFELELLCKDGRTIWAEIKSTATRDASGAITGYFGISRDMTARRAAEAALRDANLRLQSQLDEIRALHAQLEDMATRDGLTGLYNRRYLDETLEREIARAKREGHSLALVMIDVDHFKRLNDSYGHPAGDQVLVALGALLREDTRTEDVACRYGGEEFLVLLPHMTLDAARARAEKWRARFAAHTVHHGELTLQTTISLGVSAYPDHGHGADELVQCADLALYLAKHDGRNRVVVFEASPAAIDT